MALISGDTWSLGFSSCLVGSLDNKLANMSNYSDGSSSLGSGYPPPTC